MSASQSAGLRGLVGEQRRCSTCGCFLSRDRQSDLCTACGRWHRLRIWRQGHSDACPCFQCACERQQAGIRSLARDWRGVPFAEVG